MPSAFCATLRTVSMISCNSERSAMIVGIGSPGLAFSIGAEGSPPMSCSATTPAKPWASMRARVSSRTGVVLATWITA